MSGYGVPAVGPGTLTSWRFLVRGWALHGGTPPPDQVTEGPGRTKGVASGGGRVYREGWSRYISVWTLDEVDIYIFGDSTRRSSHGRLDIYLEIVPRYPMYGWLGSLLGGVCKLTSWRLGLGRAMVSG